MDRLKIVFLASVNMGLQGKEPSAEGAPLPNLSIKSMSTCLKWILLSTPGNLQELSVGENHAGDAAATYLAEAFGEAGVGICHFVMDWVRRQSKFIRPLKEFWIMIHDWLSAITKDQRWPDPNAFLLASPVRAVAWWRFTSPGLMWQTWVPVPLRNTFAASPN